MGSYLGRTMSSTIFSIFGTTVLLTIERVEYAFEYTFYNGNFVFEVWAWDFDPILSNFCTIFDFPLIVWSFLRFLMGRTNCPTEVGGQVLSWVGQCPMFASYTFLFQKQPFYKQPGLRAKNLMQLLRLRYHLLLKNCIDFAFFHCFLVKFTKIHCISKQLCASKRRKN